MQKRSPGDGESPVISVSPRDLEIVALELVTLYREVVRLAPANELETVGPALGRALEVLERLWPGTEAGDRASVLGPKPS